MSGKSSRTKGAAAERELSGRLTELIGNQIIKRNLSQTREGGSDMHISSTAGTIFVECKRVEKASIHTWLNQAEAAVTDNGLAAVAWRPSRREWCVVMTLEDFCTLVREAQPVGEEKE